MKKKITTMITGTTSGRSASGRTAACRILAAGLAVMLAAGCPMSAYAQSEYYSGDEAEHADLDFLEIEYEGYDSAKMDQALADFNAALEEDGNEQAVIECYEGLLTEIDCFRTQYSLNAIRYYNDVNNEEYAQIDSEYSELYSTLSDKCAQAIKSALTDSQYADALKEYIGDDEIVDSLLSYQELSDEELELIKEENSLVQEYDKAQSTDYSVEVDGKTWTYDSLYEEADSLSDEDYYNIYVELSKARNEVCAGIYLKLVKVRNEEAALYGYDNYADYAYEEEYYRDYTTDDIRYVYSEVKEHLVPVMADLEAYTVEYPLSDDMYYMDLTGDEMVEAIAPYVGQVSPELEDSFNYMKDHHTYDMDMSDTRMDVGYTDMLYQYGMPIIFNCTNGTFYDVETLIHEYGHYNNAYHNYTHGFYVQSNMDVGEIHSQGMELLFLEYADGVYGEENADAIKLWVIEYLANCVIQGCLYDEFQVEVYKSDEELTVHDLNRMFRSLAEEYGIVYGNDFDEAYDWVNVSHTFQSPMYYISYATSALSAFDIFGMSLENRENAVDCYLNLTTYGFDTPYRELLDDTGLQDIFEGDSVETIVSEVKAYADDVASAKARSEMTAMIIKIVIAVIVAALLITLIVVLVKRSKKKKAAQAEANKEIVTYEEEKIE